MGNAFDIPRSLRRVAPKNAATIAVYQDSQQVAYGVVTNVSVTGACIVTDSALEPGSDIRLQISFYAQPQLYEMSSRVVWSRSGRSNEKGFEGLQLHGVEFLRSSAVMKSQLHALLAGDAFVNVYSPSSTEFDVLQSSLEQDLEALGSRIHKAVGDES